VEERLLGQLGENVAQPMDRAALPVGIGPELSDRRDESGCAVGYDQERTREAASSKASAQTEPVLGSFALAQTDIEQDPLAFERVAPGHENALLGTFRTDRQVDCIEHQAQ
jgi:hypothetical protein